MQSIQAKNTNRENETLRRDPWRCLRRLDARKPSNISPGPTLLLWIRRCCGPFSPPTGKNKRTRKGQSETQQKTKLLAVGGRRRGQTSRHEAGGEAGRRAGKQASKQSSKQASKQKGHETGREMEGQAWPLPEKLSKQAQLTLAMLENNMSARIKRRLVLTEKQVNNAIITIRKHFRPQASN